MPASGYWKNAYVSLSIIIALSYTVQDTLLAHTEEIGGHLEYFQELEHATRMLNHPGESLIFQDDFLYMVERVDICLDFLKGHVRALVHFFVAL